MQNTAFKNHEKTDEYIPKGADAVVAALKKQNIDLVFGMPGGANMPVYDALYRYNIKHILIGHEQGAVHMAEGYARATGKVGVVMATSGPGATNLVTGLADAYMDSTPIVAVTGQVHSALLGKDSFQEADLRGITIPITKHNYQVTDVETLPGILAEAFYVAKSGRPGPVLIDLPKDIAESPCLTQAIELRKPIGYNPPIQGNPARITQAADLIANSRKPVILTGGGVIASNASSAMVKLAEHYNIPVTSTLMGLGSIPHNHPLNLGMTGMHGCGYANMAINECDLLIAVGARLDDRVTGNPDGFASKSRLIHIDIDESEIGKIREPEVPIIGDAKTILTSILQSTTSVAEKKDLSLWHSQIESWKKKYPMTWPQDTSAIMPQQVIKELGKITEGRATVVTGVGQHQMFTAQYYPFTEPRGLITSGGLGTMGFGLPAAIGAKLGKPDKTIVLVDGDGSFLMNIQELATAVRYRIPIVCVILKNGYLGMVRQWQDLFFEGRQSESTLDTPAYPEVARAFGALGYSVTKEEELNPLLIKAFNESVRQNLPAVVEVLVEPLSEVLPMVVPGCSPGDFIPCVQVSEDKS